MEGQRGCTTEKMLVLSLNVIKDEFACKIEELATGGHLS